jgi:hypothetical protein
MERLSTHPAYQSIALFTQATFSFTLNMEIAGSSETSIKIYHSTSHFVLENSWKYMSGRTCSSEVDSSSIFQTPSLLLFLLQLLALVTFMPLTYPQLQANGRHTTVYWSTQIAVFWDVPSSSMSKELFLYSKRGVNNFCEKMTSLYQATRLHALQNIQLNLYNYRREDTAIRHKFCSFALA